MGNQGSRDTIEAQNKAGSRPGKGKQELQLIFSVLPTALFPSCGPSDERWGFSGPGKHDSRFPYY